MNTVKAADWICVCIFRNATIMGEHGSAEYIKTSRDYMLHSDFLCFLAQTLSSPQVSASVTKHCVLRLSPLTL